MRRRLPATLAAVLLALPGAAAASTYIPAAGHGCRAGYQSKTIIRRERQVRHHRKVWVRVRIRECVAKAPVSAPTITAPTLTPTAPASPSPTPTTPTPTPTPVTPTTTYSTGVDPSFTQDPANPLAVTYSYSANATQTEGTVETNLGATDQLPAGILNFYSQGILECSTNVGGAVSASTCAITYPTTGTYSVTTQYVPTGATAVSETDQETIEPYATTTTMATSIGALGTGTYGPQFAIGISGTVTDPSGNPLASDQPLTYTITDETTDKTVGYVSEPSGQACALTFIYEAGHGAGAFSDDTCQEVWGPDQEEYAEPYLPNGALVVTDAQDTFEVTAAWPPPASEGYAPVPGYAPSVSVAWPI